MDPLRLHVFEAIRGQSCGDTAIDDTLLNTSRYVINILKDFEKAEAKIEQNKSHYTAEGKDIQRNKAVAKTLQELREIQDKSSWQVDIDKVEKRFDDIADKTDLQVLISENREREVRSAMRKIGDDPLLFESTFGQQIRDGNPTACGAVLNSPMPLPMVSQELEKIANEQYRLSLNPSAASRLTTLEAAQQIHTSLFTFAATELGVDPTDHIANLAAGGTLTEAMLEDMKIS